MNEGKIRMHILELCSESEHGSWEFWLDKENKTEDEYRDIVEAITDLVKEKKIIPMEYESVADQSYKEVQLDVNRLENEVRRSMKTDNADPHSFYWFRVIDDGEKEEK